MYQYLHFDGIYTLRIVLFELFRGYFYVMIHSGYSAKHVTENGVNSSISITICRKAVKNDCFHAFEYGAHAVAGHVFDEYSKVKSCIWRLE